MAGGRRRCVERSGGENKVVEAYACMQGGSGCAAARIGPGLGNWWLKGRRGGSGDDAR